MSKKKTLLQGVMDHKENLVTGAVYVEPKLDGWGVMFRWVEGVIKAFTHTGTAIDLPDQCAQVAKVLPKGFFFHAELTHPKGWQHIKGAIAFDQDSLIANIFDMVSEEFFITGVDLRGYAVRKNALYEACKAEYPTIDHLFISDLYPNLTIIHAARCSNADNDLTLNITAAHVLNLEAGYEGSVLKRPNGLYNLGKSQDWLRMKPVPSQDCEIVEVIRNDKGKVISLRVLDEKGVSCKIKAPDNFITEWNLTINNGLSDKMHDRLKRSVAFGFTCDVPHIGKIIEVAYTRLTDAGRMREPRFVRFREDKTDG